MLTLAFRKSITVPKFCLTVLLERHSIPGPDGQKSVAQRNELTYRLCLQRRNIYKDKLMLVYMGFVDNNENMDYHQSYPPLTGKARPYCSQSSIPVYLLCILTY